MRHGHQRRGVGATLARQPGTLAGSRRPRPCHALYQPHPGGRAALRSTLSYARLAKYVERSGLTLDELLTRYLNVAIVVEPATVPQIVRDPDDDHVLACALAARAELIVTGDDDLLTIKTYQDIPIVTAAEALRRVEPEK